MKRFALVIVLLCTVFPLVFFSQATAQTDRPKCDPGAVIKTANSMKVTGNSKTDLEALMKLEVSIHAANIACNGMTWSGNSAKLIGPFELASGVYKVSVTTT